MFLLKSQKNELYDLIVNAGFDPLQFELQEHQEGAREVLSITLTTNPEFSFYFFKTSNVAANTIIYSPGEHSIKTQAETDMWNIKTAHFTLWLDCLKREIEAPDKWQELLEASSSINWEITEQQNSKFTYQEVVEIESSIKIIKTRITELPLLTEQIQQINEKLDYIKNKAESLGRVDWKNLVVGTLINLVIQLSLPPETSKLLWAIFKEAFKKMLLISN